MLDVKAPQATTQELTRLLGRDAADPPRIRKTHEKPPRFAVLDVIIALKRCGLPAASKEFDKMRERFGDRFPRCDFVCFRDSLGRAAAKLTPVAAAQGTLEIVLLRSGAKAAETSSSTTSSSIDAGAPSQASTLLPHVGPSHSDPYADDGSSGTLPPIGGGGTSNADGGAAPDRFIAAEGQRHHIRWLQDCFSCLRAV